MKKKKKLIHQFDYQPQQREKLIPHRRQLYQGEDGNCFTLSNILSQDECKYFIKEIERIGVESISSEYPQNYRNSFRALIRSQKLADDLFCRIKDSFKKSDIDNAHPYGFSNKGEWKPIGLNDVFKFSFYCTSGAFLPHFDGMFVASNQCRSIYTLLIYLNDDYEGGQTSFFKRVFKRYYGVPDKDKLAKVKPQSGMAVIFNHDLSHEGDYVDAYKDDPLYQQAVKLYELANELEKNGDPAGATSVYLKAMDIQIQFRSFPQLPTILPEDDGTLCFSADIFANIFRFVDLSTVVNCGKVSQRWLKLLRDALIWRNRFVSDFPSLFNLENSSSNTDDRAFMKDWYQIYKSTFISNSSTHPVLCIDIGGCYQKFGIRGREKTNHEHTMIGREYHPHYLYVGGGLSDVWRAGRQLLADIREVTRPYTKNQVQDWEGFYIMLKSIYDYGLHVDPAIKEDDRRYFYIQEKGKYHPQNYPVLLAEDSIPFDRQRLYEVMFKWLEVPSLCVMNSALLASYAVDRQTCIALDCGKEGILCTPIWNGTILKDKVKMYPIGGRIAVKYFQLLLKTKIRDHMKYRVARECMEVFVAGDHKEESKKKERVSIDLYNVEFPLSGEHMKSAEIFFNSSLLPPKLHCPSENSVVDFVFNLIMELDESKQNDFFGNILLYGGLAEMKGFVARFEKEMKIKRPSINIIHTSSPTKTIIEGAYKFSGTSAFRKQCIKRDEYLASLPTVNVCNMDFLSSSSVPETAVVGNLIERFDKLANTK